MRKGQYVLVTTASRGVFAGILEKQTGDVVTLKQCRNCIYWSRETRGFLGLTTTGPAPGSRVGPAAPVVELRGVTSVSAVSKEARKVWESCPWS